jgi:hypothetical protein
MHYGALKNIIKAAALQYTYVTLAPPLERGEKKR